MAISIIDGRMINKISTVPGAIPTVAPSFDHTDGTWTALDIYEGELFYNVADEKLFTRFGMTIMEITTAGGGGTPALSAVLAAGNLSGANDIVVEDGQVIKGTTPENFLSLENGINLTTRQNATMGIVSSISYSYTGTAPDFSGDVFPDSGTGTNLTAYFNMELVSGTINYINIVDGGSGSIVGDTFTINGSQIGGVDGADDIVITVDSVDDIFDTLSLLANNYGINLYISNSSTGPGGFMGASKNGVFEQAGLGYANSFIQVGNSAGSPTPGTSGLFLKRLTPSGFVMGITPFNQTVDTFMVGATSNATPTQIGDVLDLVGAGSSSKVWFVEADVMGKDNTSGNAYCGKLLAPFTLVGGVVTQLGTTDKTEFSLFSGGATADIVTDGTDIFIQVTGEAATTIRWSANVRYSK